MYTRRRLITNRYYYAAVLPVRPSVCAVRARNWKTKKRTKIKIGVDVLHRTSKWSAANFQLKRSKVKVTGRKTSKIWRHVYLRAAAPADQARRVPTTK